jgi:hypothetical protein
MKRETLYTRYEGMILGGSAVVIVLAFWEYA